MLIEIHMLQNHSPSNLNRDDTGSPKDAFFGGVKRVRISSQCIKRSIRQGVVFKDELEDNIGQRTRQIPILIKERLIEKGIKEDTALKIAEAFTKIGKSETKGSNKKTKVKLETQLMFFDKAEIDEIVNKCAELAEGEQLDKLDGVKLNKALEPVMKDIKPRSVDIAMFGRMTTGEFLKDVEASMQVAHAIGTSKMENEYDFFTAVDDLNIGGESLEEHGAGHIGDTEFTSTTFYKYFSCDFNELNKNLANDQELAKKTIKSFIKASALSIPTGKQNSFAAHNPPEVILIEIKNKKIPISYANAFLKPVSNNRDRSLADVSADALKNYISKIKTAYPLDENKTDDDKTGYLTLIDDFKVKGKKCKNLNELADWVISKL